MNSPSERTHEHETTWNLLPWYLNGTLTEEESERVREHLARCLSCRAEAEEQETVRRHVAAVDSRPERAPAAFAALEERIDSQPAARFGGRSLWSGALRLAAILVIAIGIWTATRPNEFVVLAEPGACTGDLRIVFAPTATVAEIEQLLQHEGLAISCGTPLVAPSAGAPSTDRLYKVHFIESESTEGAIDADGLATRLSDLDIVELALTGGS